MEAYRSMLPQEKGNALLIIDPQNDFHPGGSLAIPTADKDAQKIAEMIRKVEFSEIYVTLDSHSKYHIAHPLFWMDEQGKHPAPFTKITSADVSKKVWRASQPIHQNHAEKYVQALDKSSRFDLTIWPEHCLVGTPGHAVTPIIATALSKWEEKKNKAVHYIMKGTNALTEHYSAFKAEVALENDKNTMLNTGLIERLKRHSFVFVCGQAKSHCVNWSTRDLIGSWRFKARASLVIVTDASSSVPGFEDAAKEFEEECTRQKVQSLSVQDVLKGEYKKADISFQSDDVIGSSTSKSSEFPEPSPGITSSFLTFDRSGTKPRLVQTWGNGKGLERTEVLLSFSTEKKVPLFKTKKGRFILAQRRSIGRPVDFERATSEGIITFLRDADHFNGKLWINGPFLNENQLCLYAIAKGTNKLRLLNKMEEILMKDFACYAVVSSSFEGFSGAEGYMSATDFKSVAARDTIGESFQVGWHPRG